MWLRAYGESRAPRIATPFRTAILLAVLVAVAGQSPAQTCSTSDPSVPGEKLASGWTRSYRPGCVDASGKVAAGSEILHLVNHKGKLFAAVGYWEDRRNIYYGGKDPTKGWAQVLRLDGPSSGWQVDLDMTGYLRAEIVKSVTFTTDGDGTPLDKPVTLLLASAYLGGSRSVIDLFTRDDDTGDWVKSNVISRDTGLSGEAISVRAMLVHNDAATGVDRLLMSIGEIGVYSGVYDPTLPGRIRWDQAPEVGPLDTRPLAIIEANGRVYFSAGAMIYGRIDGPKPSWSRVLDLTSVVPPENLVKPPGGTTLLSSSGGIRGLSTVPNPNGNGQSMLFLWAPGHPASHGCMLRLDPDGSGGYSQVQETCLDALIGKYLLGAAAPYVLGAYNNILPITNPVTGDTSYVIGLQEVIVSRYFTIALQTSTAAGFYAGGLYALRDRSGQYRISEVNGRFPASNPPFVAVRAYVVSPFPEENGQILYFGGYDCNSFQVSDTAWIFKTDLATAVAEPAIEVRNRQAQAHRRPRSTPSSRQLPR